MSLAEGVRQQVEAAARREGAQRVRRVVLEIGRLAAIEPQALRFCWQSVAGGSLAEGASLEIIERPGLAWCTPCQAEVAVEERHALCPNCGNGRLEIRGGCEMRVKEIEIE